MPPSVYLHHLTVRQELHGQTVQNGYYFRTNEGVTTGNSPAQVGNFIIQRFRDDVLPVIKLFANQELKFTNLVVSCISPKFASIVEFLLETSNGAQPDESLPSYCAGLISLRTGFGGGHRRGRSYYAGVSEADSADSRLDADALTALASVGGQLLASFGITNPTSLCHYGVWSWSLAVLDPVLQEYNVDIAFTPITQCIARPVLVTQRHRKIGIGD